MPMQVKERLVAVRASPALVPFADLRPHEAVLWIRTKLIEAFLTAAPVLRPEGAFTHVDFGAAGQRTARRFSGRHSRASGFASFWASEQHLSSIPEEHTRGDREPHGQGCNEKRKCNRYEEINGRCHIQLLSSY